MNTQACIPPFVILFFSFLCISLHYFMILNQELKIIVKLLHAIFFLLHFYLNNDCIERSAFYNLYRLILLTSISTLDGQMYQIPSMPIGIILSNPCNPSRLFCHF